MHTYQAEKKRRNKITIYYIQNMPKLKGKGGNIVDQVYDGAATFGRIMAYVYLVIWNIVGWSMVGIAIYLMTRHERYTKKTKATVVVADCQRYFSNKSSNNSCLLTLEYMVDDIKYTPKYNTNGSQSYYQGMDFNIRYDPERPQDFIVAPILKFGVGAILLSIALLIIICVWIYWYVVITYKAVAGITGMGHAVDIIT
jgi:hypothetical protein